MATDVRASFGGGGIFLICYRTSIIMDEIFTSVFINESDGSFISLSSSDFGTAPVYAFCLNLRFQRSIQDNSLLEKENNLFSVRS